MIYAVLGFIAALFAWIAYVARKARKSGEAAQKLKNLEELGIGNAEKNLIHNRIDSDPDYRQRVRDRFK